MKSLLKLFRKYIQILTKILPSLLVFIGLNLSLFLTTQHYFYGGNFKDLWGIYLSIIGVSGALASVLFSYASTYENGKKEEIRIIGEAYLYSTVNLVSVLIIVWVAFALKEYIDNKLMKFASSLVFGLAFGMINTAGVCLHYCIRKTLEQIQPRFFSHFDWMDDHLSK
jgi:hypothetical protein